jgi:hypothetical protein
MEVHTGSDNKPSKSVVLHTAPFNPENQRQADLSPIQLTEDTHIPVVDKFAYLGNFHTSPISLILHLTHVLT